MRPLVRRHPLVAGLCTMVFAAIVGTAYSEETIKSRSAGDIYSLDSCPVSGKKLAEMGRPVVKEYDGREVRFCCDACVPKFEADKEAYWKKIDAEILARQKSLYPLDTCVVSGKKLGDMGDPVEYVYKNRLIRFCCAGCINTFKKDPEKYLAIIDKAVVEKQKSTYPTDKCIVMDKKLGDSPVDYVVGNQLVRFCCPGCIKSFEEDPMKYLAILKK